MRRLFDLAHRLDSAANNAAALLGIGPRLTYDLAGMLGAFRCLAHRHGDFVESGSCFFQCRSLLFGAA